MMPQVIPANRRHSVIAVTGATGALGGRVAARLAAAGDVPLRLVVRNAAGPHACPGRRSANPGGYADRPA